MEQLAQNSRIAGCVDDPSATPASSDAIGDASDVASSYRASLVAAFVGFAFTIGAYYPGLLDADTVGTVSEARQRIIDSDLHSPLLGACWMALDHLGLGLGTMLMIVAASFWLGLALLASTAPFGSRGRFVSVLAIGLAPPVFLWLGVLNKDVTLLALVSLGVGSAARVSVTRKLRWAVLALVALAVATFVRHNAFFFTAPMSAFVLLESMRTRNWRTFLAIAVYSVALVGSVRVVNRGLIDAFGGRPGFPDQQIATQDLAAISLDRGRLLLPHLELERETLPDGTTLPRRPATLDDVRRLYSVKGVVPMYWGKGSRLVWQFDADRVREMRAAYLHAIASYPGSYVVARSRVVGRLYGLGLRVCAATRLEMATNQLGLEAPRHLGFRLVSRLDSAIRTGPQYRSILWIVLCIVGFVRARRGQLPAVVKWSCAAALSYALAFVLISPVCSYRLTLPIVVTGEGAVMFLVAEWWRSRRPLAALVAPTSGNERTPS